MLEEELLTLIETIQRRGCEGQTTEVKTAAKGCPESPRSRSQRYVTVEMQGRPRT